jgi:regulator of sigma E protease
MIDESMDTEQLKKPPQPYEFRSKPAWQRLLIMLGGVLVNLLLGFLIFSFILFIWGEKYLPNSNMKDGVWIVDSVMYDAGLKTGDKVVTVNNKTPGNYINILEEMLFGGQMVVNRNGKDTTLNIPPDFAGRLVDNSIHNRGVLIYPRIPFIISKVPDTSHNANSGLMAKDMIVELNNIPVNYVDEVTSILQSVEGQTVPIVVDRQGERKQLDVKVSNSGKLEVERGFLTFDQLEKLGIYTFATHHYSFFESIPAGFHKAKNELLSYIRQIGLIFNFESGAYKGVGGFGTITNLFPSIWIWEAFWNITALLSIMLAFINILPIPALDGGHVLFLAYEMISGRKPGDKFMEYAQIAGMFFLIFLLLYANGNDVYRGILRWIGK